MSGVARAAERRGDGPGHLLRVYRQLFVAQFQSAAQYRIQFVLWMLFSVIRPTIFLAAWVAVARARGGEVGGYSAADFAGYYIGLALVLHLTASWNSYEFEYEVRHGGLSSKLLRPLHPRSANRTDIG